MKNTNAIGNITESKVLGRLLDKGYVVSVPFGNGAKYDLIVEKDGVLLRVQCKTGRLSKKRGVISFRAYTVVTREGRIVQLGYKGVVEAFGVYCPETENVFLIPLSEMKSRSTVYLRIEPPKNHNKKRINLATRWLI